MATDTVTVYCKLPNGLRYVVIDKDGAEHSHIFHGLNHSSARLGIVPGAGVTHVPVDIWAAFMKERGTSRAVKNGLIFTASDASSGKAKATEREKEKTGFEGLDPNKPGPGLEKAPKPDTGH